VKRFILIEAVLAVGNRVMRKLVLDIGCGASYKTADFLRDLSLKNVNVIGIEWDFHFCKRSLERARKEGLKAEYVRCNAAFLPFPDETFDIICFLDSLRCLKGHPPDLFIKEAWRKLKPKGKVYITGLDGVSLSKRRLPIFKDRTLLLSWSLYIPLDESSPWISHEPSRKENYKCYGVLPHKVPSELLWRCGIEPEILWKIDEHENYRFYKYVITAEKG
jgi:SAM-dependent methyltransferase